MLQQSESLLKMFLKIRIVVRLITEQVNFAKSQRFVDTVPPQNNS